MPAFFNGIFGHKPTGGLVPNTGAHPPATKSIERSVSVALPWRWIVRLASSVLTRAVGVARIASVFCRICQPGPLCRYASDLWPLLNVLAGPDGASLLRAFLAWCSFPPVTVRVRGCFSRCLVREPYLLVVRAR
jgi:Asp-tRNA(Asn)/Glu-tRNA(Gln) amidotransferase A subunit family amidase